MGSLVVHEIMNRHPVSINANDYMTHARQLMRDHHYRTLPVIDDGGRVLGIITEQDILKISSTKSNVTVRGYITETPVITGDMDIRQAARIIVQAGLTRIPVTPSEGERTLGGLISIVDIFNNLDPSKVPDRPVGEVMSTSVETCRPDDSLSKIWMGMMREGFSAFPVVDKHNKPMGMVTRYDIIRFGGIRIGRENEHGTRGVSSSRVERIMSTPPYTITPDVSTRDAIEMMIRLDVGRLCVVGPEKLVGIVDRYDIIGVYASENT